eukprot:TRINITY_DN1901_c0_g1_i1.p1 TRINITY_DN1901_c0_g1~~TRINITY_DN1901_c0_g1_i1.p1  ORF type:complete len:144 (-),score=12.53 TRINITY_DN1901_c0_g1_i1:127-558(-)
MKQRLGLFTRLGLIRSSSPSHRLSSSDKHEQHAHSNHKPTTCSAFLPKTTFNFNIFTTTTVKLLSISTTILAITVKTNIITIYLLMYPYDNRSITIHYIDKNLSLGIHEIVVCFNVCEQPPRMDYNEEVKRKYLVGCERKSGI